MARKGFPKFSFWIIICSAVWWVLWFYLAAFFSDIRADPFRNALSLATQLDQRPASPPDHLLRCDGFRYSDKSRDEHRRGGRKCNGRYVYMYYLPPQFNQHFLKACDNLSTWTNMCPHIANSGLGQPFSETSAWFATNQFTAEVIFHERMKRHSCLTSHPSKATAFYVPFYAGFDMSSRVREQNFTARDRRAMEVVQFLREKGHWERMWGRDHFMAVGRITWDFLRENERAGAWGNKLLLLPEVKNMSTLLIEAHPWHANEHGIPYPSYFHPTNKSEVERWQRRMRCKRREILFSFAGAPRPALNKAGSIRANILAQCSSSSRCQMLNCERGGVCYNPGQVMQLFTNSVFCLQPQGDSFTRRSIFDSMLAGCIPVFFTEHSAYTQYKWHLPRNRTSYSVFIPEESVQAGNVSIDNHLLSLTANPNEIESMRQQIIALIPSLIYADPRHPNLDFTDAFDLAIHGVVEKIARNLSKLSVRTRRRRSNLRRNNVAM